jgi:predicted ATPase
VKDKNDTENKQIKTPISQSFLKNLKIENFKSVKSANINLSKLNLLVGANSSGKSSLIQSLLFLAQNARNGNENASFGRMDLNGTLVGFGTYSEVHCKFADKGTSPIKFSGTFQLASKNVNRRSNRMLKKANLSKSKSVEWSMNLGPSGNKADDVALSKESYVKYLENDVLIEEITYVADDVSSSQKAKNFLPDDLSSFFNPNSKGLLKTISESDESDEDLDSNYEVLLKQSQETSPVWNEIQLKGITFLNALPITGFVPSTRLDTLLSSQKMLWDRDFIQKLLDLIVMNQMRSSGHAAAPADISDESKSQYKDYEAAVAAYVSEIKSMLFDPVMVGDEDPIIKKRFTFLLDPATLGLVHGKDEIKFNMDKADLGHMNFRIDVEDSLELRVKKFWIDVEKTVRSTATSGPAIEPFAQFPKESRVRRQSDGNRSIVSIRENAEIFQPTAGALREFNSFLAEKVRYLGPLRWDPREVYGFETMSPTPQMPLGRRGEMLAKKLDQNLIQNYPVHDEVEPMSRHRLSLVDALEGWMEFLGIGGKIVVESIGAYGFRIKINDQALAMVGTGISQVLPVIVLCLLSRPGDLILLEEPEIHLNPGIQQKLTMFLMEMSKRDRVFIIETHSEYMVTRLRRIAVEHPELTPDFKIFFTEVGDSGTEYKEIKMDQNGFISSWPKNFFDHAGNDLKIIMQKAAQIREFKANRPAN